MLCVLFLRLFTKNGIECISQAPIKGRADDEDTIADRLPWPVLFGCSKSLGGSML